MNELKVFSFDDVDVVDSREVAEMTKVRHADLLEKIDGYTKHLANGKFRSLDFFIPSTYKDAQDKPRPHYFLRQLVKSSATANWKRFQRGSSS